MNYPTPTRVTPTLATASETVRALAFQDGLSECEGWSSLIFASCCGKFRCSDNAAPHGSNKCLAMQCLGHCRQREVPHGKNS